MTDHLKDISSGNGCPKCGSMLVKPVKYTWWGGMIGPSILHHTKCEDCRFTFNSKTRKPNTTNIIIYSAVLFVISFALLFAIRVMV